VTSLNERVRRLRGWIKPPPSESARPPSRSYERMLMLMNHRRAWLDYEDRKASAEAGGRLVALEPPAPLPPPTLDEMKDDLEGALRFLNEYIPLWRAADQVPESRALVDDMEHHIRDEIARLRAEIRAREEGSEA
jgi:hypothetical protein